MSSTFLCLLFVLFISLHRSAALSRWDAHLTIRSASVSLSIVNVAGPRIATDFPDPCIIQTNNKWYSFATATFVNGHTINIQVAGSDDFINWHVVSNASGTSYDALPTPGAWVEPTAPNTWAPDVNQLNDGSYVMYYAGSSIGDNSKHCVGAATSPSILGPYIALDTPIACPLSEGGVIDISGFRDNNTGQRYVLYKIDGNSIGNGGPCFNTVPPIVPTPIMLQAVAFDGVTLQGDPVQILNNDGEADTGIVESPSLIRTTTGQYVLFFSSGCYSTANYTVSYAVSSSGINGTYVRNGQLLSTGDDGLYAPGGADVSEDGHMVFHADFGTTVAVRQMYTAQFRVEANGAVVMSRGLIGNLCTLVRSTLRLAIKVRKHISG